VKLLTHYHMERKVARRHRCSGDLGARLRRGTKREGLGDHGFVITCGGEERERPESAGDGDCVDGPSAWSGGGVLRR
jgi:hypothetical protein